MNVLNELRSALGVLWWPALGSGAIGMIAAPIVASLSVKGAIVRNSDQASSASKFFRHLASMVFFVSGVLWLGALFSIFPGVLFCSVYCFIGLSLPTLGVAISIGYLCLVLSDLSSKSKRASSIYITSLPMLAILVWVFWLLANR